MTDDNGLKQSLEAAIARDVANAENSRPAPATAQRSQLTDPQRLIATAKRLLGQQQERLIHERSKHGMERTLRLNYYRAEMAKTADEADGVLTMLDNEWAKLEAEIETSIRQIKALLSAG